jgi:TonB-linked SusC/RagA family outer membrane protein
MKKILLMSFMLLFTMVSSSWAQDRSVSGKVTDETGEGVPGVNVILKGTTTGTTSDIDGNYKLNVPSEGGTLVYSFIGMTTQENEIGARSVIDVGMLADARELSEVVVTAVGIEQSKRTLGYSVQTVSADEITGAQEQSFLNSLNSKVAGISVVSSSGSPGGSTNVRIRGNSSISGSNSPLFVMDGVPLDNSSTNASFGQTGGYSQASRLVDLNSNDIASVTVLKGAAATALYGIRAANGAIIITSKRGVKGKPKVSFSTSYSIDQHNGLPNLQQTYAQGRPSGGAAIWRGPHQGEGFSWGPAIADLEFDGSDYPYDKGGQLVPKGTGNGVPARAYDNMGGFLINGSTSDNTVSVSGGTDEITYFISASTLKQEGYVPNSSWGRTSFKFNTQAQIHPKVNVGLGVTYSNSGGNRVQRGSNISAWTLGGFRNAATFDAGNGKTGQAAADDPATYLLPDGRQRSYRGGIYDNPYWSGSKFLFRDNVDRVIGNISLTYDILPWMKLSYKAGMDTYNDKTKGFADINSSSFVTGSIWLSEINRKDINSDLLLIINKDINEDLNINAVIGHNFYGYDRYLSFVNGTGTGTVGFGNISNASTIQASETVARKQINAFLADVKFDFKNFLFLNLTGRNDWSSTLPKDANSFFSPGVALGFDFTEAFGISNGNILSYGKLRGSWGSVGNDAPLYATDTYFQSAFNGGDGFISGIQYPAFGVNGFEQSSVVGNNRITPEKTTTIELGADLRLLKGRIGIDYTYYEKTSEDQILPVNISNTTGFGSAIQNAGKISNKGHELVLNIEALKISDFSWNVDVNFTKNVSLVEELPEGIETIFLAGFTSASSRAVVGQPYGAIYGNHFQRTSEGKMVIGTNGWPLVAQGDTVLGNPNPDWTMGLRNTLSWKGLSVTALLDFRQGGDLWNGTQGIVNYFGTSQISAEQRNIRGYVFDGVSADGTANSVPVDFANPANGLGSYKWVRYGFGGTVEENIQDASWIRLRELGVTYNLPSSILGKIGFSNASVSFVGKNLWLKTGFDGVDPETNLTGATNGIGLNYFNQPGIKSYAFSLRAQF